MKSKKRSDLCWAVISASVPLKTGFLKVLWHLMMSNYFAESCAVFEGMSSLLQSDGSEMCPCEQLQQLGDAAPGSC